MKEKVVRDGIEISATVAAFLDEFGMTDEEVEEMWDCSVCGREMGYGADFGRSLCRTCVKEEDGDE